MLAIVRAMAIRFRRQGGPFLALLLPAGGALAAALLPGGPGAEERGARAVLASLHYLLPPLAALFLLAGGQRAGADLLRVRPISPGSVLLGRWLGAVLLFGGCQAALAAGLAAGAAVPGGGPRARVYREPAEVRAGRLDGPLPDGPDLVRPWPSRGVDPAWLARAEAADSWSFRFEGLPPGGGRRLRSRALVARVISERSGETVHRELARAESVAAAFSFRAAPGGPIIAARKAELRERDWLDLDIPPGTVSPEGVLIVTVSRSPAEEAGGGQPGRVEWGPPFFWFDGGGDALTAHDVRVVRGEEPFALNALHAGLASLGELLFVAALAAAGAELFSAGVGFALTLTVYLLASALPFLREMASALSDESLRVLLVRPTAHLPPGGPGALERALQAFLGFWTSILPDLSRFHLERALESGEAVGWAALLAAWSRGAAAAGLVLLLALLGLASREARR